MIVFKIEINGAKLAIPLDSNQICSVANVTKLANMAASTNFNIIGACQSQFSGVTESNGQLDFSNASWV